jgi:hypothetical protein
VKKLALPILMAVMGSVAVVVIALNVVATAPVTLKMLRVDDVSYSLEGGDTIQLPTGVEFVRVDARPTDGKAVVKVTGDSGLKPGDNTLSIKVTGSDGKTYKVYTLTLVMPKLSGWCLANAELIETIETNWADEQLYEMPGYAELGNYSADIKAHKDCFSPSLVTEVEKNY